VFAPAARIAGAIPGQTIEDVCRAETTFIEDVAARHPDAEGKPVIIANCQAGWQIMMMARPSTEPDRSCWPVHHCHTGPGAWKEPNALSG
jgi:hypothetical protein